MARLEFAFVKHMRMTGSTYARAPNFNREQVAARKCQGVGREGQMNGPRGATRPSSVLAPTRCNEAHTIAPPDVPASAVEQRVKDLIEYLFGFDDTPPVTLRTRLHEDLGFNALNEIHLASELEFVFRIKVPEGSEMNLQTVGDVVRLVNKALAQKPNH